MVSVRPDPAGFETTDRVRDPPHRLTERAPISFFGIRGIGSFYYLAYAYNTAEFEAEAEFLFAVVGIVVLASIVVHGITSTPVMRHLKRKW